MQLRHSLTGSEVVKRLFPFTLFHQKDHQILPHLSWCAPQGCRVGGLDRTPKKRVVIRWSHHFLDQQGKIHNQVEKSSSGRKFKIIFIFFLITEIQAALIPLHIWRERYILITGGKEVSIMYEKKCDYSSMGDAKSWSLIELAARYYNHKKTDGCSPSFLSSVRRHIQYFMVWLKKQGFDPGQNKTNDLTSVILAGYRQMLADEC